MLNENLLNYSEADTPNQIKGRALFGYHAESLNNLTRSRIIMTEAPEVVISHLDGMARNYFTGNLNQEEVLKQLTQFAQNLLNFLDDQRVSGDLPTS